MEKDFTTVFSLPDATEPASVIGIYGVGDPKPGELSAALGAAIPTETATSAIREIRWNEMQNIERPILEGTIQWNALLRLSASLARTMLVCPDAQVRKPLSRLERGTLATSRVLFAVAESLIAISIAIVIIGVPLSLLLAMTIPSPSDTYVGPVNDVFTRDIWQILLWLLKVGLISLVCQFLVVSVLAVHRQNASPLWIAFRKTTILFLRPWLLAASSFLALATQHPEATPDNPASKPARRPSQWRFILRVTVHIVGLSCLIWAASSVPGFNAWASSQPLFGVLPFGWAFYIVLFTIQHFTIGISSPSGFLLKVMLDVFRYVGEPAYRASLQQEMDKTVAEMRDHSGPRRWFVIGHSLGSVIAVDSLMNSPAWQPNDAVTLITLGSPLKRFFFRFFPNMFFPASACKCAQVIASHVGKFRWINCYRERDYVGTTIGLGDEQYTREIKASNDKSYLYAHLNYWGDAEVRRLILTGLATTRFASHSTGTDHGWSGTERSSDDGYRILLDRVLWKLAVALVILLPVILAANTAIQFRNGRRNDLARLQRLKIDGTDTLAKVSYWTMYVPIGTQGAAIGVNQFRFEYIDDLQQKHTWTSEIPMPGVFPSSEDRQLDLQRLDRFAESHHQCETNQPPKSRPCSLGSMRIRYLKEDQSFFVIPEFLSPKRSNLFFLDAWWTLVFSVPTSAAVSFVAAWCCRKLFQLLIGHVSLEITG